MIKISTLLGKKEEITIDDLITCLKCYDGILTKEVYNYLLSIINLEFSVIENNIDPVKRETIAKLEIYKDAAIYNIYHRALDIFKKDKDELEIYNLDKFDGSFRVYYKGNSLFDFDSRDKHLGRNNHHDENTIDLNIGEIKIKNILEDKEKREAELLNVLAYLEHLYDEQNPYAGMSQPGIVGGPASNWAFEHAHKIKIYEEKYHELDNKKELSDEDKKLIEMANKYHELILADYKLTDDDFTDEEDSHVIFSNKPSSELNKVLVKKMPNLIISNRTQYL